MINKAQDHPDTIYLFPECQKMMPLTPMQLTLPLSVLTTACVECYTGAPAANESLPWQSSGSFELLQMVIISSDLVRK